MFLINLTKSLPAIAWAALAATLSAQSAGPAVLQIRADQVTAHVSPQLYGLMTEEINFSYEGGLYAELVRNRTFMEDAKEPVHWTLIQEDGGAGSMALDPSRRFNAAVSTSLKLTIAKASGKQRVGIANEGFWGIPVRPRTSYRASFYAEAAPGFKGPLTVSIVSNDGATVHATAQVARVTEIWQRYEVISDHRRRPRFPPHNRLGHFRRQARHGLVQPGLALSADLQRPPQRQPHRHHATAGRHEARRSCASPAATTWKATPSPTRFDWKKTIGDICRPPRPHR